MPLLLDQACRLTAATQPNPTLNDGRPSRRAGKSAVFVFFAIIFPTLSAATRVAIARPAEFVK